MSIEVRVCFEDATFVGAMPDDRIREARVVVDDTGIWLHVRDNDDALHWIRLERST